MSGDKKVTISIKKETLNFLKDLSRRMKEQDNRCTGTPYIIECREEREYPVPSGYEFDRIAYYDSESGESYTSIEEYKEINGENSNGCDLVPMFFKKFNFPVNYFLTYEGYEKHLKENRHNLRSPENYVQHLFRNPEMEELFKAISELGQVEEDSSDEEKK